MARKKKNPVLEVTNLGPIKRARVEFGDLTVLIGPQASGKSIFLQTLKLAVDSEAVAVMLRKQGFDWENNAEKLFSLFFGESMGNIWTAQTTVTWMDNPITKESLSTVITNLVENFVQLYVKEQEAKAKSLYEAAVDSIKNSVSRAKTIAVLLQRHESNLAQIRDIAEKMRANLLSSGAEPAHLLALSAAMKEYHDSERTAPESAIEGTNAVTEMLQQNISVVKENLTSNLPLPWPRLFYVPAHRAVTFKNSWPRNFSDFSQSDPFVVKDFGEVLRLLLEWFRNKPQATDLLSSTGLLNATSLDLITRTVFGEYKLKLDNKDAQLRLILQRGNDFALPMMVWSSGQREISPLILGLYCLVPPFAHRFQGGIKWVVLEEPEIGLHPRAISAVLFAALELMSRGIRVCISTHSPHVLDMVWALRIFIEKKASPEYVLKLFEVPASAENMDLAAKILDKSFKVYYFDREAQEVEDISDLDASSRNAAEYSWGGLTDFSSRAADLVADLVANEKLK